MILEVVLWPKCVSRRVYLQACACACHHVKGMMGNPICLMSLASANMEETFVVIVVVVVVCVLRQVFSV